MKMLREPAVLTKMGMGKTKFDTEYIKTGRARWVRSNRMKRMPEHEVDELIVQDIRLRDATPLAPPKPAFTREQVVKGARARRKQPAERPRAKASA